MLRRSLSGLLVLVALAGCPGGNAGVGESCGGNDDCNEMLQCVSGACAPRCARAPECGDGYACAEDGLCEPAVGQAGDRCQGEADCAAGLSCQIDGDNVDEATNLLIASCTADSPTRAAGSPCDEDTDCRNGTCALGHCVDLCRVTRDCMIGNSCMVIPRVTTSGGMFNGCLPSVGSVTWSIPVMGPATEILLPVPDAARSAELVMNIDRDPSQRVGAASVLSPGGARIYTAPCAPSVGTSAPTCSQAEALDQYFGNSLRHLPAPLQSVLLMPSTPSLPLEVGAYRIQVSSFGPNGTPGSAIPRVTAVVRLDTGQPGTDRTLDLHFFFLDLADHPCAAMTNNTTLDASAADAAPFFKGEYLSVLRTTFFHAGISIGQVSLENLRGHPELDAIDVADVGSLLALGKYPDGINVFFVRSLSPVGIQAFAPNPGPARLAGTRQSGIVIGLDTLCYRSWSVLARLTAHEMARYMGLYHNVELETPEHPTWRDPIDDSDSVNTSNLLYFSELAGEGATPSGSEVTPGQADILRRSPVLR